MLVHPIKTIIFDLDGTLRHNIPSVDIVQFSFAVELGVEDKPGLMNQGTRWAHQYWAQSQDLINDVTKFGRDDGGDLPVEFWANYLTRYLMALDVPQNRAASLALELNQAMLEGYDPESRTRPCATETLQAIRESGAVVGLVSNRSRPCHEELDELGLSSYLDFAYVAAEVGVWKPDPRIFDRAFQESGHAPENSVYIGDNYFSDIVGARKAGMQTVLIDPDGIFQDLDCLKISKLREIVDLITPN